VLEKIQSFANQLHHYRLESEKSLMAAKEASQMNDHKLKREIRMLSFKLQDLEEECRKANDLARQLKGQRNALEREINKLQKTHAKDVAEWTNRFEVEMADWNNRLGAEKILR
jgi:peptidoglycan hydrolase CwlO-like protein